MDRKIEKKKWTPKRIALISGALLVVVFIVYSIFWADHSTKLNVEQERLIVSTVRSGEFQEFIPVTGAVIPIETIYLDAIEGGRVETRYLEAGSMVSEGDEILKLTNTNLLLDIMYREAELFQQSNNLRNTRLAMEQNRLALKAQLLDLNIQIQNQLRDYENAQQLKLKNLIASQEFQIIEDQYNYLVLKKDLTLESNRQDSLFREIQISQLEESLTRMQENLEFVKQNLENLTIKAPVTGHLTSLNAEIGETKVRGERLGQIDILNGFKVRVNIDEYFLARINVEQRGEFTYSGADYGLEVAKIYPEVTNGRFQVDMKFTEDEPEGVRRGQTVHIRLELGDLSEALLIPRGGFFQKTGGQWIYVVDESGDFAVRRSIRLGRQNPDVFEILEGLQAGERVITSSYDNYGDAEKLILKQTRP